MQWIINYWYKDTNNYELMIVTELEILLHYKYSLLDTFENEINYLKIYTDRNNI